MSNFHTSYWTLNAEHEMRFNPNSKLPTCIHGYEMALATVLMLKVSLTVILSASNKLNYKWQNINGFHVTFEAVFCFLISIKCLLHFRMNFPFSVCQPKNQAQTIEELKMKLELIIRIYYDVASFFAFSLFILHVLCTISHTIYSYVISFDVWARCFLNCFGIIIIINVMPKQKTVPRTVVIQF